MSDFIKVYRIGTAKTHTNRTYSIFIKVKYDDKKLSITGIEGPRSNGSCIGSCGQIVMDMNLEKITPANGWTKESIKRLIEIWNAWHLNDMNARCEHQRANWNLDAKIEVFDFTWTTKFNDLMKKAGNGKMDTEEYYNYTQIAENVLNLTTNPNKPLHMTLAAIELLKDDLIKIRKQETKAANRVSFSQHTNGLLNKPCEVCGYKYGTKWLHEDVPESVLQELKDFTTTDITPAWI